MEQALQVRCAAGCPELDTTRDPGGGLAARKEWWGRERGQVRAAIATERGVPLKIGRMVQPTETDDTETENSASFLRTAFLRLTGKSK